MNKDNVVNEDIFECKLYITDLQTNKNSKEINITDLIFDDNLEFEFGDYEEDDYAQLPYKDFKFFINDYSVTFYSPQYHKAIKEIERLSKEVDMWNKKYNEQFDIITKLEEWLNNQINDIKNNYSQVNGNYFNMNYVIDTYEYVLDKLKELKEGNNE